MVINVTWKKLSLLLLSLNIILIIQMSNYIQKECITLDTLAQIGNNKWIPRPVFKSLLTIIILDFENFYNSLNRTVSSICHHISSVKVIIISYAPIYPPVFLQNSSNCIIVNIIINDDPFTTTHYSDPFIHIDSENLMVVPDFTLFTRDSSLIHLKFPLVSDDQVLAIPIIDEDSHQSYSCLQLDVNRKEWTLSYFHKSLEDTKCDALKGEFAYLMKTSTLKLLNRPFLRPFTLSFFIQNKIRSITSEIDQDIRLAKDPLFQPDGHLRWKLDFAHKNNVKALFQKFGIKKVVSDIDGIQWFGCNKNSLRCFGTVYNDTPDYLFDGRWTPPCCLHNLRKIARHVFSILEKDNVRYWLEGGSLLGAARSGDIIPWDYDVDIGIYEQDIRKSKILSQAIESPIKDNEGFVWEKANEGDFLRVQFSETNRLHVDIFPFRSKNGMMTKKTWFLSHPQDREFPESFLQPLTKIKFVDYQASAPSNVRKFLEYKFGPGVIENPEYPNPKLIKYPR